MHVGGVDHGPEVVDGGGQGALARNVEALTGAHRSRDVAGVDIPILVILEHMCNIIGRDREGQRQ